MISSTSAASELERVGRRDRHGEHKLLWPARANGAQGRARRRAGGDAVVDDDGDTSLRLGPRAVAEIEPAATLDLLKLARARLPEIPLR